VKRIVIIVIVLLLCLVFLACSSDTPATPKHETHFTAATAPLPYLLPERTLLAVEIDGLARRWPDVRALQPLARFQDRLLEQTGLRPDDVPLLSGDRSVVALVSGSSGNAVVPLAVLVPPNVESVATLLGSLGSDWSVARARGALWVAPGGAASDLENIAGGDGTSLSGIIPLDEVDNRLPSGGLARGWVNPAALTRFLRTRSEKRLSAPIDAVAELLAAEVDAVRWIGFRRDLDAGKIITDVVTAYDTRVLPREVARILDPSATAVRIPTQLPENIVAAAAFRQETRGALPWLKFLAERSPRSPLRNFEFWLEEFEDRYNRSLTADLFGALGEHAWLLVFEPRAANAPTWVLILQSSDSRRAEPTSLALLDWSVEQASMRTLGLALPRVRDYERDGMTIHELSVHTPFGEVAGPVFVAVDGYIVAATEERTMLDGVTLLQTGAFSASAENPDQPTAHMSLWARGPAITGAVNSILALCDAEGYRKGLAQALPELLTSVSSASTQAWYEPDAVRIHGEILLERHD
jgi:hypothetical protein